MEEIGAITSPVDADVQKAVRMAIAATEKKDYQTALTLFNHVYGNPAFNAPADGLSHYGICVAIAEKQTRKGIELCREGMRQQFYDSTHHANLVRLHLAKGNRKLAVQAMDEAIRSLPGDGRLAQLRSEMGYRSGNPIPFLPRNNALNEWIGRRRRGSGTRIGPHESHESRGINVSAIDLRQLQPLQMILFGVLGFATVFTVTFYILYQRAYG